MDDFTRRAFVKSSAGAAAGVATLGAFAAQDAVAATDPHHHGHNHHGHKHPHHKHAHPVVAYVRNHRTGEVALMSGDREWVVRDRKLAAQIVHHAR